MNVTDEDCTDIAERFCVSEHVVLKNPEIWGVLYNLNQRLSISERAGPGGTSREPDWKTWPPPVE